MDGIASQFAGIYREWAPQASLRGHVLCLWIIGVVDHTVTRPSGQRGYVPMRLIANASGCELLFTLFREPNMSDAQFASDAGFVQRDLNGLKRLLEK
jgi:hypothetical protein